MRLRLHAKLAAGQTGQLTYHAQRLPVGLHINATTGVISGNVRRAGLRTVTVSATSRRASPARSSSSGRLSGVRTFRRPSATRARTPALTVTARSGDYEPGLRQLTITLPNSITLAHSAGSVQVLSPTGQRLAHAAHLAGKVLTIKLALAHSPVRIVFPSGRCASAGRSSVIAVVIRTVDRLGGEITLERVLGRA